MTEEFKNLEDSTNIRNKPKPKMDWGIEKVLGLVVTIGAFLVGRFLGLVTFLFIFAVLIGIWFPKWYSKRQKVNQILIKLIVWSNVLTWFLPPLGILTGFTALGFSDLSEQKNKKYKILGIIGITLAIINAVAGIIISYNK